MTRLVHVHLFSEGRQATYVLCSSMPYYRSLLPPLRLDYVTSSTHMASAGTAQLSFSAFLSAAVRTTFWLDITLSFLPPSSWLILECACKLIFSHIKHANAWRCVDLGPIYLHSLPSCLTPADIVQNIRFEFIERKASLWRLRRAWATIEQFAPAGFSWTLNKGIEEDALGRWEYALGCSLPPDLRASFLIHDGQSYMAQPGMMLGGGRLLSLEDVVIQACRMEQSQSDQDRRCMIEVAEGADVESAKTGKGGEDEGDRNEGEEGWRMVPLSEGARGRSVCIALPKRWKKKRVRGRRKERETAEDEGLLGGVYIVTALSCRKLADSWGQYLGTLR